MVDVVKRIKQGFEETEYIVGKWLARGEMVLIFADRGVGKTYITLLLAHSLACGVDFLGHPTKRLRIIYFDGEMGSRAICIRLMKIDNRPDTKTGLVTNRFSSHSHNECDGSIMWNLSDPVHQKWYDREIEKSQADVVIIDNLASCSRNINSKDNEFDQWMRIEPWAIKKREQGINVIFVHHSGKSGTQRGTSQKENPLDYMIHLKESRIKSTPGYTGFEMIFTKTRDVHKDDVPSIYGEFTLDDNSFYINHSKLEDKKAEEAQRLIGSGLSKPEVADKLGLPKLKVSELAEKVFTPDDTEHWQEEDDEDRYF